MAISRDQTARVLRQEAVEDQAGGDAVSETAAPVAEQLRPHVAEETRRPAPEAPQKPVNDKPAAPAPDASAAGAPKSTAPKSGKRKFVLMGLGLVLALAAASYAGYYTLVGRFYISTDDA